MNYNKNYFLLTTANEATTSDSTGMYYKSFSIRNILGQIYDKYLAFSIKLESIICRSQATSVIADDYLLLQMEGLPFFNGYDSCSTYSNSRVIEMIDYANVSLNTSYNFLSACNGINFWKPSTENITLKVYHTRLNDESVLAYNDNVNFVFSITGLSNYQIHNPEKPIIKVERLVNMTTSKLILSTRNAIKTIDTGNRNRIWSFENLCLRQIIGRDYDKYKRFVLITKSFGYSENNGTAYYANNNNLMANILMSGLSFTRPCAMLTYSLAFFSDVAKAQISAAHTTPPVLICQCTFAGTTSNNAFKEVYIENVFEKSKQDTVSLNLSLTNTQAYYPVGYNASSSNTFPEFIFNFDIIPVVE